MVETCAGLVGGKDLQMSKLFSSFCEDEDGPAMVEYGLLVGLIALVVALGALVLGQDISIMFSEVASYLLAIPIPG
jgi:Flp pilus assembly pilin Flp